MDKPIVTVAIPSFNQGQFLDAALTSVFSQGVSLEVFVLDGGCAAPLLLVFEMPIMRAD